MAAPVPKHRVVNTSLSKLRKRGYFRNFGSHVTQRRRLVDPLDWKRSALEGRAGLQDSADCLGCRQPRMVPSEASGGDPGFPSPRSRGTRRRGRRSCRCKGGPSRSAPTSAAPGRLGGAASPCFWPAGMSSLCSRIWKSRLRQGTGRARGRPA